MDPQFRRLTYELVVQANVAEKTGDLTKVAGPVTAFKQLIRRLMNSLFSEEARNFKTSNHELKTLLQKTYRSFKRLEDSIDQYDLSTYKIALSDVKDQIGQLVEMTHKLDAQISGVETETKDAIENKIQENSTAPSTAPSTEQAPGTDGSAEESGSIATKDSPEQIKDQPDRPVEPASEKAEGFLYPSNKESKAKTTGRKLSEVPFLRGQIIDRLSQDNFTSFYSKIIPQIRTDIGKPSEEAAKELFLQAAREIVNGTIISYKSGDIKDHLMVRFEMNSPLLKKPADITARLVLQPSGELTMTGISVLRTTVASVESRLVKMAELGMDFWKAFYDMCQRIGVRPEILIPTMLIESNLQPGAGSIASGLIQMMPNTLKDNGWKGSSEDFRKLSGIQQIPYIESYVRSHLGNVGGTFRTPTQYYLANFWPDAFNYRAYFEKYRGKKDENGVPFWPADWEFHDPATEDPEAYIVEQNPKFRKAPGWTIGYEKASYKENGPVLDVDKNGVITYGDLQKVMEHQMSRTAYRQALDALNKAADYVPSEQPAPAPGAVATTDSKTDSKTDSNKSLQDEIKTVSDALFGDFRPTWSGIQEFVNKIEHLFDSAPTPNVQLSATASSNGNSITHAIEIFGLDEPTNLEFAKIISRNCNDKMTVGNRIKSNGIRYCVEFPKNVKCDERSLHELCSELQKQFAKVSKNRVRYYLSTNNTSSYQPIDFDRAESLSRMFRFELLKK